MAVVPPANQVDLVPATPGNTTGLHVHVPVGVSASTVNNPSDSPAPAKSGVQVTAKISQANGGPRFANPA